MSEHHPDFTAAPEERRWTKPLHELAVRLREGAWKAKGQWVYWILPAGACVAMRVHPPEQVGPRDAGASFRKELRLSRRGIQKPDQALWEAEVEIFKRHLGCVDWQREAITLEPEGLGVATYHAVATLLERNPLAAPVTEENTCSRCGKPTPHQPEYKQDLCTECAMAAGNEDAAARSQGTLDLPPYPGGGEIEPPGGGLA